MPRLLRRGGEPENARHFVKFISSFIFAAARSMILAWGEVKISTRKWREPVYTQFSQYFVWEAAFLFALFKIPPPPPWNFGTKNSSLWYRQPSLRVLDVSLHFSKYLF